MGKESYGKTEDLNRGAWTAEEDRILKAYVQAHGEGRWRDLPRKAGLKRCGKSCRLRWLNYLRPDIKRGNISEQEEDLIIRLHRLLGNKWSLIAGRLPGRTDNEIKNYWNTILRKRQQSRSSTQQLKLNSGRGKLDAGAAAAAPAAEERVIVANEGKSPASEMPEPTSGSAMEKEETFTQDRCSSPDAQMESIWDFLLNGDAQQESICDIVVENSLLHCDGEFQQLDDFMAMPSLVEQSPSCVGHLKDWTALFEPIQEDDALDVELFASALLTGEDKNRSLEILVSGE